MGTEVYVEFAALHHAADDQRNAMDHASRIEEIRAGAVLDPASLGKILPSEEIVTAFQDATEATRENLAELISTFEQAAETLTTVKEQYILTDEAVEKAFHKIAGVL